MVVWLFVHFLRLDEGDGIMDMMLKPTLTTYESKDDKKKEEEESDDGDD